MSSKGDVIGVHHQFDRDEAFRWTAENGMVSLGTLPGHTHSRPTAISDDGLIVVGICESARPEAFRWSETPEW